MKLNDMVIVYCPKCGWSNEVMRGDKLHPDYDTVEPKKSDVAEDIQTYPHTYRNPDCKTKFTVYHYKQKFQVHFFNK